VRYLQAYQRPATRLPFAGTGSRGTVGIQAVGRSRGPRFGQVTGVGIVARERWTACTTTELSPTAGQDLLGKFQVDLVHIAPRPGLTWFERADDRVPGGVEVFGRVTVPGVVAAADVAAGQANPEMDPAVAPLEAFLAPVWWIRCHVANLVEVAAGDRGHRQTPLAGRGAVWQRSGARKIPRPEAVGGRRARLDGSR